LTTINEAPVLKPDDKGGGLKGRHYLAIGSFVLLVISLPIGAISGRWMLSAMGISIALLMFFFFALLIPSDVYRLNERHGSR
jgi:hypothetical protein